MKNEKQSQERLYTIDRFFTGTRTAEEIAADIIKAHVA